MKRLKEWWAKKYGVRTIKITIRKDPSFENQAGIKNINDSFEIYLGAGLPCPKDVLAHELGHFIDQVFGDSPAADYLQMHGTGVVSLRVLKHEASAWRHALKMRPSLDRNQMKTYYQGYVRQFRPS